MKHINQYYGFPVMTAQEKQMLFNDVIEVGMKDTNGFEAIYSKDPQPEFCKDWVAFLETVKL